MAERPSLDEIPNPRGRLDELRSRVGADLPRVETVAALLRGLVDPYPPVRHYAADALADRLDDDLAEALRALLRDEPDAARDAFDRTPMPLEVGDAFGPELRQSAARILAGGDEPEDVDVLCDAAADDDPDVRYQVLVALHERDVDEDRLEPVAASRLDDTDPEVAAIAAQMVASHGWTDHADTIATTWRRIDGPERLQFAVTLAELVGDAGADIDDATLDDLVADLVDALDDEETIAAAADALVALGEERAREPLREILDRWFVHPLLRVEAAGALVELDDDRGRSYLADAIDSGRRDVRGYALRTVGRLELDPHADRLVELAHSDDYHADTAVIALADWGSDAARRELQDVAETHAASDIRRLADRALELLDRPGAFDADRLAFADV